MGWNNRYSYNTLNKTTLFLKRQTLLCLKSNWKRFFSIKLTYLSCSVSHLAFCFDSNFISTILSDQVCLLQRSNHKLLSNLLAWSPNSTSAMLVIWTSLARQLILSYWHTDSPTSTAVEFRISTKLMRKKKQLWRDTGVLLFCDGRLRCSAALCGDSGPLLCFLSLFWAAPWKDCPLWPARTWSPAKG